MFENDLADFGRNIGIDSLALNEKGCILLEIEQDRSLYIEKVESNVFFYLLRRYDVIDISARHYYEALAIGYRNYQYPFLINSVAKDENQIGFFVKMKETECNVSTINRIVNFLMQILNSLDSKIAA